MDKIKLFVDPQGNAQKLTPTLARFQKAEPDVFEIVECTTSDYELIAKGAKWINGAPQLPPRKTEKELEKEAYDRHVAILTEEIKDDIHETAEYVSDLLRQYVIADMRGNLKLKEELKEEYISLTQIDLGEEVDEEETEE